MSTRRSFLHRTVAFSAGLFAANQPASADTHTTHLTADQVAAKGGNLGVPLAAGVLFPFFGLLLNPMIAAAPMSFSSVSVISNALRLRTSKL